jgi:hypothetical protein
MGSSRTSAGAAGATIGTRVVFWSYVATAVATLVVVLAARIRNDPPLLAAATRESGGFENATVLALILLGLWCLAAGRRRRGGRLWRFGIVVFGVLVIMAGLEEMSWGQHLIGFGTPEFLAGRNIQNESNLHNLIDSEIFGALVHVPVYVIFVFPALVARLAPSFRNRWPLSRVPDGVLPRDHTVLMFCFGAGLHPWNDPVTIPDSIALVAALFMFALILARGGQAPQLWTRVHFACVCVATAVFAGSGAIFGYVNLQYEIRELVVVLAFAHWLIGLPADEPRHVGAV